MEEISKVLIRLLGRIWNKDLEKKDDWEGSFPQWKWEESRSVHSWMNHRKKEEGAENLWRVHDKLYDLGPWATKHPGGLSWITMTKGTDITEAFETHHFTSVAETILPNYYVRDAKTKRFLPFTFHEDGFFKTLKREVKSHLEKNRNPTDRLRSALLTDGVLALSLLLGTLGAVYSSYILAILSGILLGLVTICAHNFFHRKDNLRMYYFNLSLLSYRDWRISHALSHHMYANSRYDLEVILFTPFFQWLPRADKTLFAKYVSWIYAPIAYAVVCHKQAVERLCMKPDGWHELIPLICPAVMMFVGGASLYEAFITWQIMLFTSSFIFVLIGVNVAHHHPDIFHDGDYARDDKDWGLYQLDAVRDRLEYHDSHAVGLLTFGDHSMHHLFPTLDYGELDALYPILLKVCDRFGFKFIQKNSWELMKGQFQQLARTQPKRNIKNLLPPSDSRS